MSRQLHQWEAIELPDALPFDDATRPLQAPREFKNGHNASSKDRILVSGGFTSCQAVMVLNEETGEMTGFHVSSGHLNEDQAARLRALAYDEPGRKHITILKGRFFSNDGGHIEAAEMYTDQLTHQIGRIMQGADWQAHGIVTVGDTGTVAPAKNGKYMAWDMGCDPKDGTISINIRKMPPTVSDYMGDMNGQRRLRLFGDIYDKRAAQLTPSSAGVKITSLVLTEAKKTHDSPTSTGAPAL